jgi:hypothetical protein
MSAANLLQRPTFYEGQVISAADLNAIIESARSALAQHERYLHSPGIAQGLELVGTDRTTAAGDSYQEISVGAGIAIDGNGRHVVLAEAERLSEDAFDQANVAISDPEAWYPVLLSGRDEAVDPGTASLSACFGSAPTRQAELAMLTFGRVDDASDFGNVAAADVATGPDAVGTVWRTLLGFVQWNAAIGRFAGFSRSKDGLAPTYAGVRADSVVARGGGLTLRSAEIGEVGKPAVEIVGDDGGMLRFGLQNKDGKIVPVFSVSATGDLFVAGQISGAIVQGTQYQSGSAFDGTILPLPPGITEDNVTDGNVTLHCHVTPRYGVPPLPPLVAPHRWLMNPIECRVDAERRVLCRVRWTRSDTGASEDHPGQCDYTLIAQGAG